MNVNKSNLSRRFLFSFFPHRPLKGMQKICTLMIIFRNQNAKILAFFQSCCNAFPGTTNKFCIIGIQSMLFLRVEFMPLITSYTLSIEKLEGSVRGVFDAQISVVSCYLWDVKGERQFVGTIKGKKLIHIEDAIPTCL